MFMRLSKPPLEHPAGAVIFFLLPIWQMASQQSASTAAEYLPLRPTPLNRHNNNFFVLPYNAAA